MNLLYISHLCDSVASGLNYSVPASVSAQCEVDNVLWVDLSNAEWDSWKKVPAYHNIKEFGKLDLSLFPSPFSKPDVVIFEGFYEIGDVFFAKKLRKKHVPYIIIPRGSLTYSAMHNKSRIKKEIAHFLFFDSYISHSLALQYLTAKEREDSLYRFKKENFILPNGFAKQTDTKKGFSSNRIKAIFIGRLDIYHKGLDMLINVIERNKDNLEKVHFDLTLYGPELYDYNVIEKRIETAHLNNVIKLGGGIAGDNKKNAILESDVFVIPSRFEGHPMGLIEALAYGLPALATRGSNMYEEIKDSDAGWVCETNEDELEKALLKLISETDLLMEKSKNAISLADKYNWSSLAEEFHNKLIELLQ